MRRLKDQDLEHEHVVERWAATLRAVRPRYRSRQIPPEYLEVDDSVQPLQIIALGRKLLQPIVDVEEPALVPHPVPPDSTGNRESHRALKTGRFLEASKFLPAVFDQAASTLSRTGCRNLRKHQHRLF
jgi:hypothetical protein